MKTLITNLKRASAEIILLTFLCEEPMYGYKLAQEIKKRSDGRFSLMEASMYPVLNRLMAQGDITSKAVKKTEKATRTYYYITDKGREDLAKMKEVFDENVGLIYTILGEKPPNTEE